MANQKKQSTEAAVREIRRRTRRKFSPEEKIRIVLEGLRGEESIADLCRREGIASNLYYRWSKDFLEAGKKQLAGDTVRCSPLPDALAHYLGPEEVVLLIPSIHHHRSQWIHDLAQPVAVRSGPRKLTVPSKPCEDVESKQYRGQPGRGDERWRTMGDWWAKSPW